jgi:chitinase
MVNSTQRMNAFARAAEEILHRYDLDGLEIDWDYPGERGSPPSDKQRYTDLLRVKNSMNE